MPINFPSYLNPFQNPPFNKIPAGKEVKLFYQGGDNIFDELQSNTSDTNPTNRQVKIALLLEDDVSLNISSNYDPIIPANSNTFLNIISGSIVVGGAQIGSGQFVQQGIQIWKSTEPISFSLNVKLMAQVSGSEEVMKPFKHLVSLTLPSKRRKSDGDTGWGLVPPGPNISTILGGQLTDQVNTAISKSGVYFTEAKGVLELRIGRFLRFPSVVLTKCVPTFVTVLDEDEYPVRCDLSLDFVTTEIATSDMIAGIDNFPPEGKKWYQTTTG
jgi:hypothetical protein